MASGACGIDCGTCRLFREKVCSSCGGGRSSLAAAKLAAQERLLGAPCPLLACARLNQIDHCLADCDAFPCENFSTGPYPFSDGFLSMQRRRRRDLEQPAKERQEPVVPPSHWQELSQQHLDDILQASGANSDQHGNILLTLLEQPVRVDLARQHVEVRHLGCWQPAPYLLCLITVVYLLHARDIALQGRWVTVNDLQCASFFRGIHQLPLDPLLTRFGSDAGDLLIAGKRLGGMATDDTGDAALRLWTFPRIPVKLILWCQDDELAPSCTILFDQTVEQHLPADAIWGLVQLLVDALIREADA